MICVLNVGWKEVLLGEIWLVVIFLYGYGVNGVDFFGLVDLLLEYMFDIMFIVLDVFEVCVGVFFGFQWFLIFWIDGLSEEESCQGLYCVVEDLNVFLDVVMVDEDLLFEQVMLFGFLQGIMMLLYVVLCCEDLVVGICVFFGCLFEFELLVDEVECCLVVLLVYGDQDDVVLVQLLLQVVEVL